MTAFAWNDREGQRMASRLKTLAHPWRLAAVCLLANGERSVNDIAQQLGSSQPNVSQHLAELADRGLLRTRKEGNRVFYRLADHRLRQLIDALHALYCSSPAPLTVAATSSAATRLTHIAHIRQKQPQASD